MTTTYALFADTAVVGFSNKHEVKRSTDRVDLEDLKRELDQADEARGHYSTCRWIEPVKPHCPTCGGTGVAP